MTRLVRLFAAAWIALGTVAQADEVVVVELFTSQGCSSCPPADRLLGELAKQDNVIALGFHVDYWDYLGWKDEFASPEHTKRQRAYGRAFGQRSVYTPQMVIAGKEHVVGSRGMKVAQAVDRHAQNAMPINLQLDRSGGTVTVQASAKQQVPNVVVQLATFVPQETVEIRRGENRGKTLTYHNVVRKIASIGTWDGQGTFRASVNVSGNAPVVVLIQSQSGGAILGASQLR